MKGTIAIVGGGIIGNVERVFLCREHPEIIIVERVEDIPRGLTISEIIKEQHQSIEKEVFKIGKSIEPFFDRRKKKPKNAEWQNRMKQLMRG